MNSIIISIPSYAMFLRVWGMLDAFYTDRLVVKTSARQTEYVKEFVKVETIDYKQ